MIQEKKKHKKSKKKPSAMAQVHNRVNAGVMDGVVYGGMMEAAEPEDEKYEIGMEEDGYGRVVEGRKTIYISESQLRDLKKVLCESASEREKKFLKTYAVNTYGTTDNFDSAGFILTTGELLNFGNYNEIYRKSHGALDLKGKNFRDFINAGNIRVNQQSPGIEFCEEPTDEQYKEIHKMINHYLDRGVFYVDCIDSDGKNIWNKEYRGEETNKVVDDIKLFFRNGVSPEAKGNDVLMGYSLSDFLEESKGAKHDIDVNYNKYIKSLIEFMREQHLRIDPLPEIELNPEEQDGIFVKTGYYSPDEKKVVVFTDQRHPKDVLRTVAHEFVHHMQNLQNPNNDWGTGGDLEADSRLRSIEGEAFLLGNIIFREWTEKMKKTGELNESKKRKKQVKNDKGELVPETCDKCGGKVVVQIHGEPVYVCKECGKYFGTMPCTINESVGEMRAFHGSPNNFNEFDEFHVGEGAGAQLWGWGTYVTTDRKTGENYCVSREKDGASYLYEVEIPDDNGNNYINLNGNPPQVYKMVYNILKKEFPKAKKYFKDGIKTAMEQDTFAWFFHNRPGVMDEDLSKALDKHGIVGIKYENGSSYNYLIFRANNVKIINKTRYQGKAPLKLNEVINIKQALKDLKKRRDPDNIENWDRLDEIESEIVEPDDVDLSSFNIKKYLNPKFWDNGHLDTRIRLKLLDIADDFFDSLDVDWVEPVDVIITGSIANYNWNKKYSDIDLHILVDYEDVDERVDFVREYFTLKKNAWNEKHKNLRIFGFPVEVYVQDANEPHASSGVYSIDKDKWLTEPDFDKLRSGKVDKRHVREMVSTYMNKIDCLIDIYKKHKDDEYEMKKVAKDASEMFDEIKNMRKDDLGKYGREMCDGNIIFKALRRSDYIGKLIKLKDLTYDKINSL